MTPTGDKPSVRPNLLVAGAARSGTTALSESLARHSSIRMSRPKEVHFLTHVGTTPDYRGPGDDVMMSRIITEPDAFFDLYRGSTERYRAEGSVTTLYWPDRSLPNIEQYCEPDVKVVCILREPVARAHSAFLYLRSRGHEPFERMADALAAEEERTAAGYHHMWHYEAMSRYHEQLPTLVDAFGDRLHLLVFDEFRENPAVELERLCRFLDIAYEPQMLIETDINRGGEIRFRTLDRLIASARSSPMIREAVVRAVPRVARDRVRAKNLRQPELEAATLDELRTRLAPATAAVEAALGRALPAWRTR